MEIHDPTKEDIEKQFKINMIKHMKEKQDKGELEQAIKDGDIACIPVTVCDEASIGPLAKKIMDATKKR